MGSFENLPSPRRPVMTPWGEVAWFESQNSVPSSVPASHGYRFNARDDSQSPCASSRGSPKTPTNQSGLGATIESRVTRGWSVVSDRIDCRRAGRADTAAAALKNAEGIRLGCSDFGRQCGRSTEFRHELDPRAAGHAALSQEGHAGVVDAADQGGEMRPGWNAAGGDGGGPGALEGHAVGGFRPDRGHRIARRRPPSRGHRFSRGSNVAVGVVGQNSHRVFRTVGQSGDQVLVPSLVLLDDPVTALVAGSADACRDASYSWVPDFHWTLDSVVAA